VVVAETASKPCGDVCHADHEPRLPRAHQLGNSMAHAVIANIANVVVRIAGRLTMMRPL